MKTTRTQFVQGTLAVCSAGLLLAACGGDDDDAGSDGSGASASGGGTACGATIATNHGHKISVTKAQAMAGTAKSYDIQGDADHNHTVDISAAEFATLAGGEPVTITSSTDAGHSHSVLVDCG